MCASMLLLLLLLLISIVRTEHFLLLDRIPGLQGWLESLPLEDVEKRGLGAAVDWL